MESKKQEGLSAKHFTTPNDGASIYPPQQATAIVGKDENPQTKGLVMSAWIDFKKLKLALQFTDVLRHYQVEVKRKGDQHHGFCPLPNHKGVKNSPSFSANLKRGIFQCFGCGAKGNVLDFAAFMEGMNPKDGAALHAVALKMQKQFCPEFADSKQTAKPPEKKAEPAKNVPMVVNAPLDFELKGLDAEHPYLKGRGFTTETIKHFGLGFCSRGFLKNRAAIPLHDHEGKLVGYAGRVIDDALVSEDNPRYQLPGTRERDGKLYEFRKTLFLYNGFRMQAPVDDLIVVEGFPSVWWLHQNNLSHVVATMGSDCSEKQAELIASLVKPLGRVWMIPDGDKAGERFAQSLLLHVTPHRFVRWVKLKESCQPTDLSREQLKTTFTV